MQTFDDRTAEIVRQYPGCTPEQMEAAFANADKTVGIGYCVDVPVASEQKWLDALAASLGSFEESN